MCVLALFLLFVFVVVVVLILVSGHRHHVCDRISIQAMNRIRILVGAVPPYGSNRIVSMVCRSANVRVVCTNVRDTTVAVPSSHVVELYVAHSILHTRIRMSSIIGKHGVAVIACAVLLVCAFVISCA